MEFSTLSDHWRARACCARPRLLGPHDPAPSQTLVTAGDFGAGPCLALEAYDRVIGLGLAEISADGCITKAPSGGERAGRSPVDRGKQGL